MGESAEAAGTGSGGGGSDDTPAVCCGVGGRLPEEAGYLLYGGSGVPPAFAGRHFFKVSAYIISGLQSYCERRCKPAV